MSKGGGVMSKRFYIRKLKKISVLFIAASMLFALTACEKSNDSKKNVEWNNQENEEKGIYLVGTNLKHCSNNQGLYYLKDDEVALKDGGYGYKLLYIDFTTRQEVYLCNNAGCNHNTEECTAVVSATDITWFSTIFINNGYVYILSKETDDDGLLQGDSKELGEGKLQYEVQSNPAKLYRMNLDGSERKLVYEFDENFTVEDTVLGDENNLYFVTKRTRSKINGGNKYTQSTEKYLTKIDTSTWETENVIDLMSDENGASWKVIGGFDNSVVLNRTLYDHERSVDEIIKEFYDEDLSTKNFQNSQEQVAVFNLNTGTEEMVFSGSNDTNTDYVAYYNFVQHGERLYVSQHNNDKIYVVNMKNGKQDVLTELKESSIGSIWGGKTLLSWRRRVY